MEPFRGLINTIWFNKSKVGTLKYLYRVSQKKGDMEMLHYLFYYSASSEVPQLFFIIPECIGQCCQFHDTVKTMDPGPREFGQDVSIQLVLKVDGLLPLMVHQS